MVELGRLQRLGRHNLDLAEILTAFCDELLGLDQLARVLRHHRDGFTVLILLIVGSLVLIEERQMREDLTANVALEADVGNCVLKRRGGKSEGFGATGREPNSPLCLVC